MRVLVIVVAALATLGLAAFGVIAAQHGGVLLAASGTHAAPAATSQPSTIPAAKVAQLSVAAPLQAPIAAPTVKPPAPVPAVAPTRVAEVQNGNPPATAPAAAPAAASPPPAPAPANAGSSAAKVPAMAPGCDKPGAMGISRTVQIDTTGGPAFGFEHFKQYDFLTDHEVVLTFDDGPWPGNTPAVIKALTDQCLKATFFEIGEHATWHPEISKLVAEAGMTIGSHTWSHKDLARNPYASNIDLAEQEIELGVSAVHHAVGGPIAPFFRFPDLQQPPQLLAYLGTRGISTFSTDIDSRDFKLHRPEQVIKSVIGQLQKRGKGIVLMHDFQRGTAEALPELLRQLKANGFKIVHMVPKAPVTTLAKYDDMLHQQDKMDVTNTRPQNSVVKTISGN